MKNILLLFYYCAILGNLSAQTFTYNFPGDFDNTPAAFVRKDDGRFLIAGTTGGVFSSLEHFNTKGYLLDWDTENGLQSHKLLEIYGVTTLLDAMELSNGNIIVVGRDNFCSAPNIMLIYAKCFDTLGNLLWTTYTDTIHQYQNWLIFDFIPLAVRPSDGKVAILYSHDLTTGIKLLDQNTGQILFAASHPGEMVGLKINPINNNMVLIGKSNILQINPENGMKVEKKYLIPNWDNYTHVFVDSAGTIWALSKYGRITKWLPGLDPTTSFVPDIWGAVQWTDHGPGYAELRKTSATGYSLKFFDADFQLQSVITLPDLNAFNVVKMYLDTGTIFFACIEEHGPDNGLAGWKSSNLLIHRFGYDGAPKETEDPDLAVTGITVEVPPVFSEIPGTSNWQITGGKYVVTIRNNGNVPVDEAHILSGKIGKLQTDICFVENKHHYSAHLQNLNLTPGEETTVTIDSLNIIAAAEIDAEPWRLCFWAAAPDQRRDMDLSNDHACLVFYDVVPTKEPVLPASIRVLPNPAITSIRILLSEGNSNADAYRIFSTSGRLMKQGVLPIDAAEFSVGVAELPAGFYFVEAVSTSGARYLARFVRINKH